MQLVKETSCETTQKRDLPDHQGEHKKKRVRKGSKSTDMFMLQVYPHGARLNTRGQFYFHVLNESKPKPTVGLTLRLQPVLLAKHNQTKLPDSHPWL